MRNSPSIVFQKPNRFKLICTLLDGSTKSKYFQCKGRDDKIALKEIADFILSEKFPDFIQGVDAKWSYEGEVQVGTKTKEYFDGFKFDIRRGFKMDKRVGIKRNSSTLSVSITDSNWGCTHRFDDTYFLKPQGILQPFNAVVINVGCSSTTAACKILCGGLVSEANYIEGACSLCKVTLDLDLKTCENCFVSTTNYCLHGGLNLCRACHVYKNNMVYIFHQDRFKHPHFECKWLKRLVLSSDDLTKFKIYNYFENATCQESMPVTLWKRPNLSTCDTWDMFRIGTKATPQQIFSITYRREPLFINNNSTDYLHKLSQIQNRTRVVDAHYNQQGWKGDDMRCISDWRDTEKILEPNFASFRLFQGGG